MSRAGVDADIAQSVERILGKDEVGGSNPPISSKKEVTFVYQKLLLFLSKPQAWYIITTQSWISSAPLGLYLITR